MQHWLGEHWLAVLALVVAFIGGWPGVLQIIEHFRPVSLSGSIKFFAPTESSNPPRYGILLALTLLNKGSKNLVWRALKGTLVLGGKRIPLAPMSIPSSLSLNGQHSLAPDLMNQQVIPPGTPINPYLLLGADEQLSGLTPLKVIIQFELESSKSISIDLPFDGVHPVRPGEGFPTHSMRF